MKKKQQKTERKRSSEKRCRQCKQKKSIREFDFHDKGSKRQGKKRSECNDCRKKIRRTGTCQRKRTVAIQDYIKLQRLLYELGSALNQDDQFQSKIDVKNAYIQQIEEAVDRFEKCVRCKIELKKLERYFPLCIQCAGSENPKDLVKKQQHSNHNFEDEIKEEIIDHNSEQIIEENQTNNNNPIPMEQQQSKINNINNNRREENLFLAPIPISKNIEERDMDWYIFDIIERDQYPTCRRGKWPHQNDVYLRPMFTVQSKIIYSKSDKINIDMYMSVRLWCFECKKNYFIYNPRENNHQRYQSREQWIQQYFEKNDDPSKRTLLYKYLWNWAHYLNRKYQANIKIKDREQSWAPIYRNKMNYVIQFFKDNPDAKIKKYQCPDFPDDPTIPTPVVEEVKD